MSLQEIRKQIASISKTSQITNAMALVSTTKYNNIVETAHHYDLFADQVNGMVSRLISQIKNLEDLSEYEGVLDNHYRWLDFHDLLIEREIKDFGYMVITSDKGLAGSYNSQVIKRFEEIIEERNEKADEIVVFAVGQPIVSYCKKNGIRLAHELHNLPDYPSFTQVQKIVQKSVSLFKHGVYDELDIIYNHSKNALQTQVLSRRLLPLSTDHVDEAESSALEKEYIFEPSVVSVLEALLPMYAESIIYGAIIDAKTAEQGSRMQAMRQATDNATGLINDLKYEFNQERQVKITNEIIEVVSGADAQDKGKKEDK